MSKVSPLSYIRKQKKLLASVSLWVAGMQVFGYSNFMSSGNQDQEFFVPDTFSYVPPPADFDELFPYNVKNRYPVQNEAGTPVAASQPETSSQIPVQIEKSIGKIKEIRNFPIGNTMEITLDPEPVLENKQGIIGKSETFPIDDPSDNTFAVNLDDLSENSEVYLVYDLFGLEDAAGASISINDQYSRGGYLVKKSNKWTTHKEKINPEELVKGVNYIRFSTLASADYQYMIKNLRLESEEKGENNQKISLHQTELNSYNGNIYLSGYADKLLETLFINGKEVSVTRGFFETIVENAEEEIRIITENEELIVQVAQKSEEAPDKISELQLNNSFVEKLFPAETENTWSEFGAGLTVPAGSMEKDIRFFLSALRYQDISATSPEMVNVTGIHSGFRLLPHGEHFLKEPATLEIPYDESKIPSGYKPQDIKTFYFDQNQRKWIALERDTVLLDKKVIVSKTTHFTDFINGIIKVPESPETGSFTPTSIKDIKAADPAAGVVSIAPPSPNNMGTANTSFPIKLPAGRAGMQPSLSVNYNSEGGNGWMGMGWDISIPSVSIDTRWGAPRYDLLTETEIYSLGGEMLTLQVGSEFTNPHRTANISRTSERQFYPRKENGGHAKVIRHGTRPNNYWWEVTDKMGNKSFYGGYPGMGIINNAVIKTTGGMIAHWGLYRTEDTNGNYVEYTYIQGSGSAGHEFYPQSIEYTKHKTAATARHYRVSFVLDSEITSPSTRTDIQTNARLGLVQSTSKVLSEIKIDLMEGTNAEPIRSYRFDYQNPNFSKEQLVEISEYDANNQLFYSNTMEYFNEVTDGDFMDTTENSDWSGIDDGIYGSMALSGISSNQFTNEGSILGFSTGWGANGGVSVGVGTGINVASKSMTAGASFDYSYSQNNGIISLIDINGDNLPDKVMRKGNNLSYRLNRGDLGENSGFGPEYNINGSINTFSESTSNSTSIGFESNFFVFLGYTRNKSKNVTKTYFSDVNGDGLPDIVNNGKVMFNAGMLNPEVNQDVTFNIANSLTPNAIEGGQPLNQSVIDELNQEIEDEFHESNPLHDVVKVWIAPAPGNYYIYPSTVTLNPIEYPEEDDEYLLDYDGVKITIEKGTSNSNGITTNLLSSPIVLDLVQSDGTINYNLSATIPGITVNGLSKGQRIYFRVNSQEEGTYDRVEWTPSIKFLSSINRDDANGLPYYTSTAEEGFIMSGTSFITIPSGSTGTVNWNILDSQYTIPPGIFSDNLTYKVLIGEVDEGNGEFIVSKSYTRYVNQNATTSTSIDPSLFSTGILLDPPLSNFILQPGQSVKFEVQSTSNVDWKIVNWEPIVSITNSENETSITNGLVNYSIYKNIIHNNGLGIPVYSSISGTPPTSFLSIDTSKAVTVTIDHIGNSPWASNEFDGNLDDVYALTPEKCYPVRLIVKNADKKVIKRQSFYLKASAAGTFYDPNYSNSSCTTSLGNTFDVTIPVSSNPNLLLTSPLYVEFHTDSINLAYQEKVYGTVKQNNSSGSPVVIGTVSNIYALFPTGKFGAEYRNWGQFSYNSTVAPANINETYLKLYQPGENMPEGDPFENCDPEGDPDIYEQCMQEQFDLLGIESPQETKFIIMSPNENMKLADETIVPDVWEGYDEGIYVEKDAFGSSRLGVNNINSVLVQIPESGASIIPGIALVSKGEGNSYAGNAGPVGGSISDGHNYLLNQYMDMNGDRYPDLMNRNTVQYTLPSGGLNENLDLGFGEVIESNSNSEGASVSGTFKIANTPAIDQKYQKSQMAQRGEKVSADSPVQLPSGGSASLSVGNNDSSEKSLWIDMNGDGLPDRVDFNDGMSVRLNLGYSLADPQSWLNSPGELTSSSKTYSGGLGFSMFFNSISGGVSGSATNGFTRQNFADINGDGLPDLLIDEDGGKIVYRLNTGTGFESTSYIINNAYINTNRSIGEGANIAFTVGFTLWLVKFTVTPRVSINRSVSRTEHTISDINGDGYADILYTDSGGNDGDLKVRLNKIGKTHLLKRVNLPLGGHWEIDYEREQNSYEMPNTKWKMTSIEVHDGFTADNEFTPDVAKTAVEYRNGRHDRREREFMGYGEVQVNQLDVLNSDEVYRYSLQEFHTNSYYLKGAVKMESLFDANDVLWTSTETTYAIMARGTTNPANVVKPSDYVFSSSDFGMEIDRASLFVSPVRTTKKFTEGGVGLKTTFTEIEAFDAFGNITQFKDNGEGGADEVTTDITYENHQVFRALPETISVKSNGSEVRFREAEYDLLNGNLTKVKTKLNDQNEYAQVSFEYLDENGNNYGNIQKVTHENSLEDYENPNSTAFFYEYTYDDQLHTYPVTITDAFGYSSNNTYDYRFGALVYTEDMNYMPMRTRIDDRGRVVEITGPYELFVEGLSTNDPAWTIRFEYEEEGSMPALAFDDYEPIDATHAFVASEVFDSPQTTKKHHALTRHFDPEFRTNPETPVTNNQIYTITLIDGLGKPIQVKKSTSIMDMATNTSGEPTENDIDLANNEYWLINGKVETDAFGRALKTWYPTEDTFSLSGQNPAGTAYDYIPSVDTAPPTEATYDVLDRVLTTKLPGEQDLMTTAYAIENSLFKTTVVNEKGQTKHSFTDVRGRTTKVVEEATGGNIETTFEYNAIGELLTVKDAGGNLTTSEYDLAGRRIKLEHPDNGITTFKYDKASNLEEKVTANLLEEGNDEVIKYHYTFNRLDSIVYPKNPHNNVHFFYGQAQDASAADDFSVGRLWYQIDATGVQQFKYGRLGEVRYNLRSVAVPGDKAYWFKTEWEYDTWNRVKKIIYPDEEEVTYFYNRGGELHAITSKKQEQQNEDIISQLGYDKFGQRTYLRYGNGTETEYTYETERRRLENMTAKNTNRTFIDNDYTYDVLSNVLNVANTAALPGTGKIGGTVEYTYTYDDLNRLKTADAIFTGRNATDNGYEQQQYTLAMKYDNLHNIVSKEQLHQKAPGQSGGTFTDILATTYKLDYTYEADNNPHAPREITDKPYATSTGNDIKTKTYDYDPNGNLTSITQKTGESETVEKLRTNLWDEENRLRAVDITPDAEGVRPIAIYTYDAGGERILKHSNTSVSIYLNGKKVADTIQVDATLYPSGMLVAKLGNNGSEEEQTLAYTKHYYAGTQRVSSKIGTTENLGDYLQDWYTSGTGGPVDVIGSSFEVLENAETGVVQVYNEFDIEPPAYDSDPVFIPVQSFVHGDDEIEQYFFHPDHLGSTSYITNLAGEVSQHMEYFAFGETFVEEHRSSNNSPYKFNGKELDEETGWYYYGARYYDPRISVWLSVDPLVEKTLSAYTYCENSPINFIDPDGNASLRWPPTIEWQPMEKGDIQRLYPKMGAENGLNRMWDRYNKQNVSSLSRFQYISNPPQLKSPSGKLFKPDGKLKYSHSYIIFQGFKPKFITQENLSLSEVTTARTNQGNIGLFDKNSGQIKAYIDYLADYHKYKGVQGAKVLNDEKGRFNLITLPEITDVSEIRGYSSTMDVDFNHYVPYYKLSDDGKNVDIEFRLRKPNLIIPGSEDKHINWEPIQNNIPDTNTEITP